MGQARHKKRIALLGRQATRGMGIQYYDSPKLPRPTADELAERELRKQEQQAELEARALLTERQRRMVDYFADRATEILDHWRGDIQQQHDRIRNFAGWTTDAVCQLPVDQDVAQLYAREFGRYTDLNLDMRDEVVQKFHQEHKVEQVISETMRIVRSAGWQAMQQNGLDAEEFLNQLEKRGKRQGNSRVRRGLKFVSEMMPQVIRHLQLHAEQRVNSNLNPSRDGSSYRGSDPDSRQLATRCYSIGSQH
jgi:hypothetical protein